MSTYVSRFLLAVLFSYLRMFQFSVPRLQMLWKNYVVASARENNKKIKK